MAAIAGMLESHRLSQSQSARTAALRLVNQKTSSQNNLRLGISHSYPLGNRGERHLAAPKNLMRTKPELHQLVLISEDECSQSLTRTHELHH